jgi:hypothetical protein
MLYTMLQVMFEAVRGNGYRGDIALDDITFVTQSCTLTPANASPSLAATPAPGSTMAPIVIPNGFTCNFDSNFCSWTQDKTDNFDWTRQRQGTRSGNTGPSRDHTSGQLLYIVTYN